MKIDILEMVIKLSDIANHGMKYAVESVRLTVSGSPTTSMSGSIGTTSRRSSGTYGTTTTPAGSTRRPITSPVSMLTSQQPTYNFSQPTAKTALRKGKIIVEPQYNNAAVPENRVVPKANHFRRRMKLWHRRVNTTNTLCFHVLVLQH